MQQMALKKSLNKLSMSWFRSSFCGFSSFQAATLFSFVPTWGWKWNQSELYRREYNVQTITSTDIILNLTVSSKTCACRPEHTHKWIDVGQIKWVNCSFTFPSLLPHTCQMFSDLQTSPSRLVAVQTGWVTYLLIPFFLPGRGCQGDEQGLQDPPYVDDRALFGDEEVHGG